LDKLPEMVARHSTYAKGYDPELAKSYAEQAGIVNGKELRIITNGTAEYVAMAEIIQQNLRDIGVNSSITNYDTGSWRTVYTNPEEFDLVLFSRGHPSFTAAGVYYGYVWSIPYIFEGGWANHAEYIPLCEIVMGIDDVAERVKVVSRMAELIEEDAIWYSICDTQRAVAINKGLSGFRFAMGANYYFNEWSW
jgi:peptide/nickel transport system substrate-binding protein